MKWSNTTQGIEICLANGIELKFVLAPGRVKGIGRVSLAGKKLRSEEECIYPEIATPDGMEVDHYELAGVEEREGCIVISTRPFFRVAHRMEWMEHAMHQRINTSSWSREPFSLEGTVLEWRIREESEHYDGVDYTGFSYGFRYRCPGFAIYQIEDKATWELGGSIIGNTMLLRGGTNKPVVTFLEDTYYYTGWDLPGIANPHIFQHMPLYTCLQGFTFQHDEEDMLITVHEKPSHVRSLFLKEKGDGKLLHFNQFCFDLAEQVTTPARRILVGKRKAGSQVGTLNHFLRVRDIIHQQLRDYYGLKNDTTRPVAHVETWQIANVDNFRPIFEQLDEWGIKRAFVMPLWRSNETEVNPRFKEDRDRFGFLGNMCCPLELEIADCYGGWEGLKEKVLSRAVELGIETYMWFGSHFSSLSPLEQRIKDIFARDTSGQINRNNYGHVLFAVNQNSTGYQEYLINAYRRAKECGLKGVFRDSHFNMASDTINYMHIEYDDQQGGTTMDQIGFLKDRENRERQIIRTMHDTEIAIQSRFQNELGMLYYVESPGAIGTPMCGTDYEIIRGYEFMFCNMDTGMNFEKVRELGDDIDHVFFKGLSVRLMYQVSVEVNKFPAREAIDAWWNPRIMAPMCKAFFKVEPHLKELHVLEDGNGVLWKDGETEVVFAYKEFHYPVNGRKQVLEAVTGLETEADGSVQMEKMRIYRIK